jgi:hypothetical protein
MIRKTIFLAASSVMLCFLFWLGTAQSNDWQITTAFTNLPEVSGLQIDGDSVYATFETRQHDGQLVSLSHGVQTTLVDGLQKPDGLSTSLGRLIYTQEFGLSPVFELDNGISTRLFDANGAEGVDSTLNGDVYVVEDRKEGRVLKYERSSGLVTVLASGLDEAEGLCVMESGDVFYSEKGKGEIFRIRGSVTDLYLSDLNKPGYLYCDEATQSIWITEDRRNFGRLLYSSRANDYSVIATGLKSPQSIAFNSKDSFLLAEQGRDRILSFHRAGQAFLTVDWADFTRVPN